MEIRALFVGFFIGYLMMLGAVLFSNIYLQAFVLLGGLIILFSAYLKLKENKQKIKTYPKNYNKKTLDG